MDCAMMALIAPVRLVLMLHLQYHLHYEEEKEGGEYEEEKL